MAEPKSFIKKLKVLTQKLVEKRIAMTWWPLFTFITFLMGYLAATTMAMRGGGNTGQTMLIGLVFIAVGGIMWLSHKPLGPRSTSSSSSRRKKSTKYTVADFLVDVGVPVITFLIERYLKLSGWLAIICFTSFFLSALGFKKTWELEDDYGILEILNTIASGVMGATDGLVAHLFALGLTVASSIAGSRLLKWAQNEDDDVEEPQSSSRTV